MTLFDCDCEWNVSNWKFNFMRNLLWCSTTHLSRARFRHCVERISRRYYILFRKLEMAALRSNTLRNSILLSFFLRLVFFSMKMWVFYVLRFRQMYSNPSLNESFDFTFRTELKEIILCYLSWVFLVSFCYG